MRDYDFFINLFNNDRRIINNLWYNTIDDYNQFIFSDDYGDITLKTMDEVIYWLHEESPQSVRDDYELKLLIDMI